MRRGPQSPEARARLAAVRRGQKHTPRTRAQIGESVRRLWRARHEQRELALVMATHRMRRDGKPVSMATLLRDQRLFPRDIPMVLKALHQAGVLDRLVFSFKGVYHPASVPKTA